MREFVRSRTQSGNPRFDLLRLNPSKLQTVVCAVRSAIRLIRYLLGNRKVKQGISNYKKIIDEIQSIVILSWIDHGFNKY